MKWATNEVGHPALPDYAASLLLAIIISAADMFGCRPRVCIPYTCPFLHQHMVSQACFSCCNTHLPSLLRMSLPHPPACRLCTITASGLLFALLMHTAYLCVTSLTAACASHRPCTARHGTGAKVPTGRWPRRLPLYSSTPYGHLTLTHAHHARGPQEHACMHTLPRDACQAM